MQQKTQNGQGKSVRWATHKVDGSSVQPLHICVTGFSTQRDAMNSTIDRPRGHVLAALLWICAICICISEVLQNWAQNDMEAMQQMEPIPAPTVMTRSSQEPKSKLRLCQNAVTHHFEFAIVIAEDEDEQSQGAIALGKSIRAWQLEADMIRLSSHSSSDDRNGWTTCTIQPSPWFDNRLKAWALVEYKAILVLETDTLVVGDASFLFTKYHGLMKHKKNSSLGAVHSEAGPCPREESFSTAVLLVTPSLMEYLRLRKHAMVKQHMSFRQLLSSHFGQSLYGLPPEFNANIAWKHCNFQWWSHANIKILHFTIAKPWVQEKVPFSFVFAKWNSQHPWACWLTSSEEMCALWRQGFYSRGLNKAVFCWLPAYNNHDDKPQASSLYKEER